MDGDERSWTELDEAGRSWTKLDEAGRVSGNEEQACFRCVLPEPELSGSAIMRNKLVSDAPAGCFVEAESAKFGKQVNPMLQNA